MSVLYGKYLTIGDLLYFSMAGVCELGKVYTQKISDYATLALFEGLIIDRAIDIVAIELFSTQGEV